MKQLEEDRMPTKIESEFNNLLARLSEKDAKTLNNKLSQQRQSLIEEIGLAIDAKSEHCTIIRPNGDRLNTSVITVEDVIALLDKLEEEK